MAIKIDKVTLEHSCKEIIETILFCLPNAFKGTVYLIGKPPDLIAERITSGIIDIESKIISWGFPERSGYNPPGKPWSEYRDEPDRPLEALAWCVEKQKSWTAEDPKKDSRSVRLQVEGVLEDCYYMEPVLIRKEDLFFGMKPSFMYPKNLDGDVIWQDSEYVVVAVIKIHFLPDTIKMCSPEARIIKKLSRSLGTELLSYQLRQQSVEAMRQLAEDKLNSCNILADSLRNALTKSGLIFSLIKLELGSLREQWEGVLLQHSEQKNMRRDAILLLDSVLRDMNDTPDDLVNDLIDIQNRSLDLFLPPERGENWIRMQIENRWDNLIDRSFLDREQTKKVRNGIRQLKSSLYLGSDPEILARYIRVPEDLKREWTHLLYKNTDQIDFSLLERLIRILEDPSLELPFQEKSRKSLIHLKNLAQVIGQLEEKTNTVLRRVLNGYDEKVISNVLNGKS